MELNEIRELTEYYRQQGAPADQQMLIALLREAQEADGGILSQSTLHAIAEAYALKDAMLMALIRRIPALRCEDVPHKLEVCGTCRAGAAIRDFIETEYHVKSGGVCKEADFSYRITTCMKNCKNGPSVRWDGVLHPRADIAQIKKLIEQK